MRQIDEKTARMQIEFYRKHRERAEAERKVFACKGDWAIPRPWQQGYLFGKPVAVTGFGEDLLRLLEVLKEDG